MFFSLIGIIFYTNNLILGYHSFIYTQENLEENNIGLVFGGGMTDASTQTQVQYDRVQTAIELYNNDKIKKIMLSGDDGANRFDEVSAMKKQVLNARIPENDILLDSHGYRTYESCYRAKHVFHIDKVIAISHNFHLSRIRYLCENLGIRTIAFSADKGQYDTIMRMNIRETLARVKAWWQIEVTKPLPQVIN